MVARAALRRDATLGTAEAGPGSSRAADPFLDCRLLLGDAEDARRCTCPPGRCLGGGCKACFGSKSALLLPGRHLERERIRGYYVDLAARARVPGRVPPWVTPGRWIVATCQAGLGSYERFLAGDGDGWLAGAIAVGRWLVEQQARGGAHDGGWEHVDAFRHTFDLRPPWLSGMGQGEGASLLVRLYLETNDEAFAEAAERALKPLARSTEDGGVQAHLDGYSFPEEYPTSPPSFVLNGAFFALWGCHDVSLGLGRGDAGRMFREGVEGLAANIDRWDTGYWSRYDLYPHPVVNVASADYHRLHISLLRVMGEIVPRREFAETAARFEGYAASKRNLSRAFLRKAAFRLLVPRNRLLAMRLPWPPGRAGNGRRRESGALDEQILLRVDDRNAFVARFARQPASVRHSLVDHPLLTLEAIAELADALPLASVERHRADLPVLMPGGAPEVEGPPSETVRDIETNGCWMVLWYIEQVSEYRALLDAILDEAEAHIGERDGGMQRREAFLFLSAPGAVTPVHFDPEHNFLLQVRGAKDMNVCEWDDPQTEQRELNRYHDGGHRNLDAMPTESTTFHLAPGDGVYVPPWRPHWVQNGDAVSISLSITFRTVASERAERVHALNSRLRRLHLSPRPPGSSERIDRAKEKVYMFHRGLKGTTATRIHKG